MNKTELKLKINKQQGIIVDLLIACERTSNRLELRPANMRARAILDEVITKTKRNKL